MMQRCQQDPLCQCKQCWEVLLFPLLVHEPCSSSVCVCTLREAQRHMVQVNVNLITLCYLNTKNRTVEGYLCIQTAVTLKEALCWCEPLQVCLYFPAESIWNATETWCVCIIPLWTSTKFTGQSSLGSLGWTYFHMGSSSASSGNMDNTTLLFGSNDLIGDAFISEVSENGKCAGKWDIDGCTPWIWLFICSFSLVWKMIHPALKYPLLAWVRCLNITKDIIWAN